MINIKINTQINDVPEVPQDSIKTDVSEDVTIKYYDKHFNQFTLIITRYINVDVVYDWSLSLKDFMISSGSCDKVYFCDKNNKREITFSYFNDGGRYTCSHSIIIPNSSLIWDEVTNKILEWDNKDKSHD